MIYPIRLCIFDLNGTLANTPFVDGGPLVALAGRREKLEELRKNDCEIAVATNQAGPPWREATGQTKYPLVVDLADELESVLRALGLLGDLVIISLYDSRVADILTKRGQDASSVFEHLKDDLHAAIGGRFCTRISIDPAYRKPAPGMLLALMQQSDVAASETLYVGDRPEDERAAANAGCHFQFASEFFTPDLGPGRLT